MQELILEAIKKARESKRNFKQTFDLIINLKNLDMRKPESKIKAEVLLPKSTGRKSKIGIFADALIPRVKETDAVLIRKDEIETLGRDKKKAKKIASECLAFFSEPSLMATVGKFLGPVLAVRGKMPKPIPPTVTNINPILESAKNTVRIVAKDSPVIQCVVGAEDMKDEDIIENINTIYKAVETALPKGKDNIRNLCIKLTMGKPQKVRVK